MYIFKVKGKKKIPNYIQIRDDHFVLIGYFSFKDGRPIKNLEKYGLGGKETQMETLIKQMPFGKLQKLNL